MARQDPEDRLERLARAQHGVVSQAQAARLGMSARALARRVAAGRWVRVHPGVFRPAGAPISWFSELLAAVLWAGTGSMASHRAAARLWELDGSEDAPIEIAARTGCWRPGVIVHRLRPRDLPATRSIGPIPVTTPERTLLDLAAVLSPRRAGIALDDALRQTITTLPRLRAVLEAQGGPGRRGTAALRRLLAVRDETDEQMESVLERRLFRLLRRAGLPRPTAQHEVRAGGRLVARLDFAYPELRVGIETHGYRWHGGYQRWQRDIRRENALKRLGWRILVFTWDDVRSDPERVSADVHGLLAAVVQETPGKRSDLGEPAEGT